ncbi:MAG: thiamine pyrophosphate-binding protein, partial [Rhodobacteraceae bacterium]|nr:thiamine pyrophosphate-binding protein [Paracoccaceae bacterium]
MRTGGEVLADLLVRQGVETVFGVPGESYLALLDALYDKKDRIRTVMARHEGGAAFMAAAQAGPAGPPGLRMGPRGAGAAAAA